MVNEMMDVPHIVVTTIIAIMGYFLKDTMSTIKTLKSEIDKNNIKITVLERDHSHLTDKFDDLYLAVKELTQELKELNKSLNQKKN